MDNINIEPQIDKEKDVNDLNDFAEEIYEEEEDLFSDVKKIKSSRQDANEIEDVDIYRPEKKKSGVFGKLRKINGAKKANMDSDIW